MDGEVVIAGPHGLDFDALLLRIHPAASRVARLAASRRPPTWPGTCSRSTTATCGRRRLRSGGPSLRPRSGRAGWRRRACVAHAGHPRPGLATGWFDRFEGAGLDGVVAKRLDGPYEPGRRAMIKIKHQRTADCAVAGFRWYQDAPGELVGSLLLGLHDAAGTLHHVGVTSSFTREERRALAGALAPLREGALEGHPWAHWKEWEDEAAASGQRLPGATSRWNPGQDLSWEPLRVERVCEVAYDHLQGDRFRHATTFRRWRPDRTPADCRYDQLQVTPAFELAEVFGR